MTRQDDTRDSYTMTGLQRGLAVLETLAEARRPLSPADIAKRLDLTRGVIFRILHSLRALGFVREIESGKLYVPGPRVLSLGFGYLRAMPLVDIARPHLEALREAVQASTQLAVLDGTDITYLSRYPSRTGIVTYLGPGDRAPAHATTIGRALLSLLPPETVRAMYRSVPLSRHSASTATDIETLLDRLAQDRANGFVMNYSGLHEGIASIAAPIRDGSGAGVAGINITAFEPSIERATFETETRDRVIQAAGAISAELGA